MTIENLQKYYVVLSISFITTLAHTHCSASTSPTTSVCVAFRTLVGNNISIARDFLFFHSTSPKPLYISNAIVVVGTDLHQIFLLYYSAKLDCYYSVRLPSEGITS